MAYKVLVFISGIELCEQEHVVAGTHYHNFIKDFQSSIRFIIMRSDMNNHYDIQRCKEA